MRGPAVDRRPFVPPTSAWKRNNATWTPTAGLVLGTTPGSGASAFCWIPIPPGFATLALIIPATPHRGLYNTAYKAVDRITPANNSQGLANNGSATLGSNAPTTRHFPIGNPAIRWVMLTASVSPTYTDPQWTVPEGIGIALI